MGKKSILGVIPARGGSKGLPRKNILPFAGKPLMAWTIDAARNSGCIDRVIVSTDDEEIASIAKEYGADVPFMRPVELASDAALNINVLLHAMEQVEQKKKSYDIVMYLQPTSPLRAVPDITGAVQYMFEKDAQAVVSISPVEHPPMYANTIPVDRSMKNFIRRETVLNRQELGTFYRLNGAIFVGWWEHIMKHKDWFGCWFTEHAYGYVMPQERSIDIDTELDFFLAESLMKRVQKAGV